MEKQHLCLQLEIADIRSYKPDSSWFLCSQSATTKEDPHGNGHCASMLILGHMVCQLLKQKGISVDESAVYGSVMTHDLFRERDDHGFWGAAFAAEQYLGNLSNETVGKIVRIVRSHAVPNGNAPEGVRNMLEYRIFKTIDTIDRVRLDELPDATRFRLPELSDEALQEVVTIAENLWERARMINTGDPFNDVLVAAVETGVVAA